MPVDPAAAKDIFLAALDHTENRSSFVDAACSGNPELRARVQELLEAHESGSFPDFLARTAAGDPPVSGEPDLAFLDPPRDPAHLGRLDQYEVLSVLGRGGMGVVLKAHDEPLDRPVAIKVLAPEFAANPTARRRFVREARAVAAVVHEHVVAIHHVDERVPYLVMQFVAGVNLQDRIDRSGPLPVVEVLRIGAQVARGLAAAHAVGLVHRDVKPANVLLENGVERVKLTDFGLARAVDDASVTQSGVIAGTPLYMSPEQARGEPADPRSDLFSLGGVLYAMATGHAPFKASGTMAVLRRVIEDDPRPPTALNPYVPDWLEGIVLRLLAKDPADRFASATAVADLLEQHLAHEQQPDRVPRPRAPRRRRPAGRPPTAPAPARGRFPWLILLFVPIAASPCLIAAVLCAGWFFASAEPPAQNGAVPTPMTEVNGPVAVPNQDPPGPGLRGDWVAVAGEYQGAPIARADLARIQVVFTGNRVRLNVPPKWAVTETTYALDPLGAPGQVDVGPVDSPTTRRGIYQRVGPRLELCLDEPGSPRPTAFTTRKGAGMFRLTLEREPTVMGKEPE